MTADIQTLNFITHKLERLPLGDALVSENLPRLFCMRGINDVKGIYSPGLKTSSSVIRNATPVGLADWRYDGENVHGLLKRSRAECQETFCFTAAEPSHELVFSKFLPLKKKRPSETTSQENITWLPDDDDEVRTLCNDNANCQLDRRPSRDYQSRPVLNTSERSLFKPVARRPKSRPSVGLADMKAMPAWCPPGRLSKNPHLESKLVKVQPFTSATQDNLVTSRKDYCFRPIVASGLFEANEES